MSLTEFISTLVELYELWKMSPYLYERIVMATPVIVFFLLLAIVAGRTVLKISKERRK